MKWSYQGIFKLSLITMYSFCFRKFSPNRLNLFLRPHIVFFYQSIWKYRKTDFLTFYEFGSIVKKVIWSYFLFVGRVAICFITSSSLCESSNESRRTETIITFSSSFVLIQQAMVNFLNDLINQLIRILCV